MEGGRPVVLGLSGGPDSLSLLDILLRCGVSVIGAHFDHTLREESGREADYVGGLVEKMNVPFVSGRDDVQSLAREKKWSIEEAARYARYSFLFAEARRNNAQAVAVAHNADDQVETVLMHILRGTGLNGLKGMAYRTTPNEWDAEIPIIRPLLGVWRAEILEYCAQREFEPVFDKSNLDPVFFRNRLRLQLIPDLEQYNPRVKQSLWRMSRLLEDDADLLTGTLDEAWKECLILENAVSISLQYSKIKKLPVSLQRMIIRKAIASLLGDVSDIGFDVIERGRRFLEYPTRRGRIELMGRIHLFRFTDRLILTESEEKIPRDFWPQLPEGEIQQLTMPFNKALNPGWTLQGEITSGVPDTFQMEDPDNAWLDADCLEFPLEVRRALPGDRFKPLGLENREMRLSDFWVNQKIPRFVRGNWPLIVSNDQIIWIPGQRPAYFCRLTPQTKTVLSLRLVQSSEN